MLRFVDSFDHYAIGDITTKWTTLDFSTNVSLTSSAGRNGTNGFRVNNPNGPRNLRKTLDAQATWILGCAFRVDNLTLLGSNPQPIMAVLDAGTNQAYVGVKTDGTLVVVSATTLGTSSFALSNNQMYYIEFKVTIANSGTYDVRVDGSSKLSGSGDTQNTGNATANQVNIGSLGGSITTINDWDDFYACDGQGSANNNFLGDVRIEAIFPSGAGNSTVWTPSAGSNFQCVDESTPNGDTDYVSSATPSDIDLYAYGNVTPTAANVKGVQTCIYARKDDAGTRTIKPEIRSGGSNFGGTNVNVSTSYAYYLEIFESDPNTSASWTLSNVNAAEFGVNEVA